MNTLWRIMAYIVAVIVATVFVGWWKGDKK